MAGIMVAGRQADMVLESSTPGSAGWESDSGPGSSIWNPKAHSQWHISSNKAIPNSAILYWAY